MFYLTVILWATMKYWPVDGLQLAPEPVCSTWCDWEDLLCMRVISLAGWVGFLRSQIWTPALVLRLTRMDSMEWML